MADLTVKKILSKVMTDNGYAALGSEDMECTCEVGEMGLCDSSPLNCVPLYAIPAHCDDCVLGCEARGETKTCYSKEKPPLENRVVVQPPGSLPPRPLPERPARADGITDSDT